MINAAQNAIIRWIYKYPLWYVLLDLFKLCQSGSCYLHGYSKNTNH